MQCSVVPSFHLPSFFFAWQHMCCGKEELGNLIILLLLQPPPLHIKSVWPYISLYLEFIQMSLKQKMFAYYPETAYRFYFSRDLARNQEIWYQAVSGVLPMGDLHPSHYAWTLRTSKDNRSTFLPFLFSLSSFFSQHQPVLGGTVGQGYLTRFKGN